MPIQIIVAEGALTPAAEAVAFRELTDLLLRLHGLTGNHFMTPNVIGEVSVVPKGRSFSGGEPTDIAVFELKVPSFVLPTQELKDAWISEGTTIIEATAAGRIKREYIFANVTYASKAPGASEVSPTTTWILDRRLPPKPRHSSTPASHSKQRPLPVIDRRRRPFARRPLRGLRRLGGALLIRDRQDQLRVVVGDVVDPDRDLVPDELAFTRRHQ
jgi:hypothetical protein